MPCPSLLRSGYQPAYLQQLHTDGALRWPGSCSGLRYSLPALTQPAAAAAAAVPARWLTGASAVRLAALRPPRATPRDEEEEDVEAIGDLGDASEEEEGLEEFEEDVGPQLSTGGVPWGEKALAVVQELLSGQEGGLKDIQLFSFRAIPSSKRLDIRLDKLTDKYGSPSLDDIAAFGRQFNEAFEAAVGEAAAGEIEVEVSSPGAERQVRVPGELARFQELPMKVEYLQEGDDKVEVRVLRFQAHDEAAATTRWGIADVRANRTGGKGRGLSRKQRDAVVLLPLACIRRVNLHIDF